MGVIITRSTRTWQPQGAYVIDRSNPLARGLAFICVGSDGRLSNLVTSDAGTPDAGLVRSAGAQGRTFYVPSGTYAVSWPGVVTTSDGSGTGDYTLLSLSAPVSESSISALISQGSSSSTIQAYILANTNSGYGAAAGYVTFGDEGGGGNVMVQSSTTPVDGRFHVFVGVREGSSRYVDCDGLQVGSGSGTVADIFAASSLIYASGIQPYSGWTRPHPHALQAAWNRALSPAERVSIGRNPWQLFTPLQRRIWVPSAGGAGGTAALTGSAVTASAGTLTPSVSIPLSGQAATASSGTLTPSVSTPLSGQATTAAAGTVSPTVTIALTGTAVTASAGTVTYSAGNNISLTLTGAEVTASAGSLGLNSTVPVSGSAAAASAGTLTPGTSVAVSGTAVTASAGTLTYSANQDLTLALSGEAVQVSAGTITVIGGVSAVAVTSGAPGPRQQRWVVYINGKRYIGSLQEIEQIVAEFAEEQAEKAQTTKPTKKPKIKVEAGRVLGKTESAQPAQVAQQQEQVVVQQQVRDIYAEAYARAIAQMELDEEEDIISLL